MTAYLQRVIKMNLMHPSNNNMLDFWGGINLRLILKYPNMFGLLSGRQGLRVKGLRAKSLGSRVSV
jgi:hypothetical protein